MRVERDGTGLRGGERAVGCAGEEAKGATEGIEGEALHFGK